MSSWSGNGGTRGGGGTISVSVESAGDLKEAAPIVFNGGDGSGKLGNTCIGGWIQLAAVAAMAAAEAAAAATEEVNLVCQASN